MQTELTADIQREGDWFVPSCAEVPESNGPLPLTGIVIVIVAMLSRMVQGAQERCGSLIQMKVATKVARLPHAKN